MSTFPLRRTKPIAAAVTLGMAAAAITVAVANGGHAQAAAPGPFTPGDLVVYRVGDGSAALSTAAAPVYLDEYTTGGTSVVSVPLPTAADGAQHRLTASGTSVSEGSLGLSADGRYLVTSGYDAAIGTTGANGAGVSAVNPAAAGRVIARVDGNASIDATTALTDSTAPSVTRAVASTDGSRFWLAGGGGPLSTATLGATTGTPVDSTGTVFTSEPPNVNALGIVNGQLYASGANGVGVSAIGSGAPTSTAGATGLPGVPARVLATSFALLAVNGAAPDTLYYVDGSDRAGAIEKYTLTGSTWTARGSVALDGVEALTARASGGTVTLYATTPSHLYALTDTAGSGTLSGTATQIATAGTNTAFRGISFAPAAVNGPSVVEVSPATGATVPAGTSSLPVTAQVLAPNSPVSKFSATIDSGTPHAGSQTSPTDYSATIPLAGVAAGAHTVTVSVTDAAGRVASDTRRITLAGGLSGPTKPTTPAIPAGVAKAGKLSFATAGLKVTKSGFSAVTYKGAPKPGKGLISKTGKGSVSLRFYGREVDLHLGVAKNSGRVKILIDGKTRLTVDLNGAKSKDLVKTIKGLKLGIHTLKIQALHTKSAKSKGYTVTVGWFRIVQ